MAASLAAGRTVDIDTVAHVALEVLQGFVLVALGREGLGAHLLVTAAVTAMQRAQLAPFQTIGREMGRVADGRAERIGTDAIAGVVDMFSCPRFM